MWAHYSDHHTGVAYVFDSPRNPTLPLFEDPKVLWGNVVYSSTLPEVKVFQGKTNEAMLSALLEDIVLTKSVEWSYERELRFFGRHIQQAMVFNSASLRAVVLGRRISDENEALARTLVRDFNQEHESDVKVLVAHRIASTFSLGISFHANLRRDSESSVSARIPILDTRTSSALTESSDLDGAPT
jgi:hypothetical protein